jgi:hypothetical protein
MTDIQRDGKWWFCKIWPESDIERFNQTYPEPEYSPVYIYDGYPNPAMDLRNRDCPIDDERKAKLREQLEEQPAEMTTWDDILATEG